MAEGGFDEIEMENMDREEYEKVYNSLGTDALDNESERVEQLLRDNPNDADAKVRFEYLDNLMENEHEETSFTTDHHRPVESDVEIAIGGFIFDERGQTVNRRTTAWLEMRLNTNVNDNNNVTYNRVLKNGKRGKPQIVLKRDGEALVFNDAKVAEESVRQFKETIDKIVDQSKELDLIVSDLPMVETRVEFEPIEGLTETENREHRGVLNPLPGTLGRTGAGGYLQVEANNIQGRIDELDIRVDDTSDPIELETLSVRRRGLVQERDETIVQRQLEEETPKELEDRESVVDAQYEDVGRLQKFKEWAKENMLGLSAVGITVAGLITTVVVAGRKAVFKGAQAVGAFGKMLAKVGKSLGPLLAPLMSLLANVISLGAKGLLWLSQNLWLLAVGLTFVVYEYWKGKK